jgi:recombination protein RecR
VGGAIEKLIEEFSKFPGIGRKTAQRLTYHLLKVPKEDALGLSEAVRDLREKVKACSVCANLTEIDPCDICRSEHRERDLLCVVEEASDVRAIERTGEYKGLYQVLGGVLSPLDGVGPGDLAIDMMLERVRGGDVREVIVATNPSVEGEATALYIKDALLPLGVKVTRIARGLPVGGDIEYADDVTISRAIEGRRELP